MAGNNKGYRRQFGAVRRVSSGRWQARYQGPDGSIRNADRTFDNRKDAERWLSLKESEIARHEWVDPDAGAVPFEDYAAEAGASLRELMNRMGHSSTRAALVYLHARDDRARDIADALGDRAADELKRSNGVTDGDDDEDNDPPAVGAPG
ncbi:hypothetical protein RIF23_14900 [Lipingzhangella sp. LS1_29]|uniref:Phage L5-like integrase N-terminal domain-containing protein n=1 Tax=Lipingzhangella rawalii TaxID=2055835 RepID=A0ABU2H8G0_9ACTN|nr:hypothetical protein [Lipingzhangella rawalii]MDS1271581.1 hypothetical protein [Lipingzhangella rawalii]